MSWTGDTRFLRLLDALAENLKAMPSADQRGDLAEDIKTLTEYLEKLGRSLQALPEDSDREKLLEAIRAIRGLALASRDNPALASLFGGADKKGTTKKSLRTSRQPKSDVGLRLFEELRGLPLQTIQERLLDIHRTSMQELHALAAHIGLRSGDRVSRQDLVDRVVKIGFANVRGYEGLRSES